MDYNVERMKLWLDFNSAVEKHFPFWLDEKLSNVIKIYSGTILSYKTKNFIITYKKGVFSAQSGSDELPKTSHFFEPVW